MTNKDKYFWSFVSIYMIVFMTSDMLNLGLSQILNGQIHILIIFIFVGIPAILKHIFPKFNDWLER